MPATKHINKEHNGIEVSFPNSERPDEGTRAALKEHGFRWHTKKHLWFARHTPEREAFIDHLLGNTKEQPKEQVTSQEQEFETKSAPKEQPEPVKQEAAEPNTFAAHYDTIGNSKILDSADVEIFDFTEAYFKDENIQFRRTYSGDNITVTDLTNAGQNSKTCPSWGLQPAAWNGNVGISLYNDAGIHTCKELIDALRSGKDLEGVKVYPREIKAVEVFSPFTETKPLKALPERWNKRNFAIAFQSGQIYQGQVDQRLTDDYAMDAAYNFSEGVQIAIPAAARDVVEDWYKGNSVHTGKEIKPGVYTLDFYNGYSTSKTFYFDLNCDIKEGKRRAEEREAGVQSYNKMLESGCIDVKQSEIDPGKIYTVTTLDKYTNSGVYATKDETLQGHVLRDRLDPDRLYMDILSVKEMAIEPTKFYAVANFHDRREHAPADDRIAEVGNYKQIVTGKALLELTAEGEYFPMIRQDTGEFKDIESARKTLSGFIAGQHRFMVTGLSTSAYESALDKLEREYVRAGGGAARKPGLDGMIAGAQARAAAQQHQPQQKSQEIFR